VSFWRRAFLLTGALTLAGCGTGGLTLEGGGGQTPESGDGSGVDAAALADSATSAPVTIPLVERIPEPGIGLGVLELDGYAVPILQRVVGGWVVLSPCGNEVEVTDGVERTAAHVVIDPDAGAAQIARAIERRLAETGVSTVLSRWADVPIDASTRALLAETSGAHVFVSLRFVPGASSAAGPADVALVHRVGNEESRRLGGLLYAELAAALGSLGPAWPALEEPGVHPLLNQRGTDYFVVLRESGDVAAVVVDIPGRDAPATSDLLSTADGQSAIGEAVATAIEQFLGSEASGSGYVEPAELVRDAPTGGSEGECNDPLLPPPIDE
jgi:hypothetical protein